MKANPSEQPSIHLCKQCGRIPKTNEDPTFVNYSWKVWDKSRDRGRICECEHCEQRFLEYDISADFYGPKAFEVSIEGTDWIPITKQEVDILRSNDAGWWYIKKLVTTRSHLYRENGRYFWHKLKKQTKAKDLADSMLRALKEVNERSMRKGGGWVPQWDEMNGNERREYLKFLEEKTRHSSDREE
ncbi:MAG: hypothetical protein PHH13_00840 [Candidatus Peribacteraceae bacterium]|nr:hypothetical protein [Candidatus Peribacteraceae bacterium]